MPLPDFLPGRFALSRGRPSDYFALEHFHYLPRRPATYADVWVVRYAEPRDPALLSYFDVRSSEFDVRRSSSFDVRPSLSDEEMRTPNIEHRTPNVEVERQIAHDALESRWRCAARRDAQDFAADRSRLAAVGVLSFPSFRCLPRERTLGLSHLSHKDRLAFTNAHVRTISRVVVHPQFRALGLASQLVRQLIAVCPTRYVEASAVMAHVHPFFATAGMRRVDCEESENEHTIRPAYYLFDKQEGSPCEG